MEPQLEREPETPDSGTVYIRSALGAERGVTPVPMVVYGHQAESMAAHFAQYTSLSCLGVWGLDEFDEAVRKASVLGVVAMSRPRAPGEAGAVLRLYRDVAERPGMALYGAWDYNVERGAQRALEYRADGVLMPGIDGNEQLGFVLGVLDEVLAGATPLSTVDQHVARLRRYTTEKSPFWKAQDLVESPYY